LVSFEFITMATLSSKPPYNKKKLSTKSLHCFRCTDPF